jgi:hypothetical protein
MATNSPAGSIADHGGQDVEPTRLGLNCLLCRDGSLLYRDDPPWPRLRGSVPQATDGGRVAPESLHTTYPLRHRSGPLKEIVP